MATGYTSILKLALPVEGELSGTWGDVVNDNITSMVEQAIAGRAVINSWTTNAHTLTTANGASSESRCAMLELTDSGSALSSAATVVCPAASKIYIVKNAAGQNATIKTPSGSGILVPNGRTSFLFCDGTNVIEAITHTTSLQLGTSTVVTAVLDEDNLSSNSATSLATQQSIKAYVDAQITSNNELSEVLASGNTTGGTDIVVSVDDVISMDNGTNLLPSLTTTGDLNTGLYFPAADQVGLTVGGTQRLNVSATGVDVTGTVTADGLVVAGATTMTTADNTAQLTLISTDADGSSGPKLTMFRNSGSPADGDALGIIDFTGEDSNGDETRYVAMFARPTDVTNGDEFGKFQIIVATDGVDKDYFHIDAGTKSSGSFVNGEIVFNEDSQDIDFRVESDASAQALFVEGSSGNVGIGTTAPSSNLHIEDTSAGVDIRVIAGTSSSARILLGDSDYGSRGRIVYDNSDDSLAFWGASSTTSAERLRINSGGDVLFGTTDTSPANNSGNSTADNGTVIGGGLVMSAAYKSSANAGSVGYFNRTGTDGDIVQLFKSGVAVGSIGVRSTDIPYFASSDNAGIKCDGDSAYVGPANADGSDSNGDLDLGVASNRWRNLYLTTGVNISEGNGVSWHDGSNVVSASIYASSDDSIRFRTTSSQTERMRIDLSGRLLVGTSAKRNVGAIDAQFQVEGVSGDTAGISITRNSADQNPPYLILAKSRGSADGAVTAVQADDDIGRIRFAAADGTDASSVCAEILVEVDGTPGANDTPGRLIFSTTPDGGSIAQERMRIDKTGVVNVEYGGAEATPSITIAGDTDTGQWRPASNTIAWSTGGAEAMRIDSSGNLYVATTGINPQTLTSGGGLVYAANGSLRIAREAGGATNPMLDINNTGVDDDMVVFRKDGAIIGSIGVIESDRLYIADANNGLQFDGAVIRPCDNDGDATNGVLSLGTSGARFANLFIGGDIGHLDAADPPNARLLYDKSENLLGNTGTNLIGATAYIGGEAATQRIGTSSFGAGSTTLYIGNAAIQVSSDRRLKTNIVDTEVSALDKINQVRVVDFNWDDPSDTALNNRNARGLWTGVIAQELIDVFPFAVNAPRNETDLSIDNESEENWTVDQQSLVPVLMKALQEALTRIETLEAAVTALQGE